MSLSNLIEIATDEKQTEDDWTKILDVCEKGASNPKECLKLILKRMFNRNPHIVLRSIILLDACVQNIGESFAKEISSRYFIAEIKAKSKGMHQKALERLCFMMKKWKREYSGNEFDFINELNKWLQETYPTFYAAGDDELNSRNPVKSIRKDIVGQEDADLAKAIALSLKETESKRTTSYQSTTSNIFTENLLPKKSMTKVRALYDFEAAEENELTFKAGEIIIDVDTSNEHWWTGSNHRGEGMFPAQFVTVDLDLNVIKPTESAQSNEKAMAQADQSLDSFLAQPPSPVIDESKIDECNQLIEDADPTGEMRPDPAELSKYEAQCRSMGPLIDQELEKVDRHYNRLVEINKTIMDSYQMYNELMTQGGIMRPSNYMWQPQAAPGPYYSLSQVPTAQDMFPRISQQMVYNGLQQQPQPQDAIRFQTMNYYNGIDHTQNNSSGNNQAIMGVGQSIVGPNNYQIGPTYQSLDSHRQMYPPTADNATVPGNMPMLAYTMHNNFPSTGYPYSTSNQIDNNIPYANQ